jgi:hypothetical protein
MTKSDHESMLNKDCVCYWNCRTWIIYLIQMLIKHNGFDFESIESSILSVFGYGIW